MATLLLGVEAATWAAAYRLLGALLDNKLAMLYSLSAMTSYGHVNLFLKAYWELMGALEALDGMMLFGLTTAFLFSMIQMVWPLGSRQRHNKTCVAKGFQRTGHAHERNYQAGRQIRPKSSLLRGCGSESMVHGKQCRPSN